MAAQEGHLEIVKLLVKKGAVVDQPDNDGCIALGVASLFGHLEVVDFLLSADHLDSILILKDCPLCTMPLRRVISVPSSYW